LENDSAAPHTTRIIFANFLLPFLLTKCIVWEDDCGAFLWESRKSLILM
jgi:hypothetical protein